MKGAGVRQPSEKCTGFSNTTLFFLWAEMEEITQIMPNNYIELVLQYHPSSNQAKNVSNLLSKVIKHMVIIQARLKLKHQKYV